MEGACRRRREKGSEQGWKQRGLADLQRVALLPVTLPVQEVSGDLRSKNCFGEHLATVFLALSHDGKVFVSGSADGAVRLRTVDNSGAKWLRYGSRHRIDRLLLD